MSQAPDLSLHNGTNGTGVADRSYMPRALTLLVGLAAVFLAAQGIQEIQGTIAAAFMALNLVVVVWPIQRALARHIPRFLASTVAGLTALAALTAMMWSIGWTVARLIQELPRYNQQFYRWRDQLYEFADRMNIDTNLVVQWAADQLNTISPSTIIAPLQGIVSSLTNVIAMVATVVMILFFMILDSVGFSERMQRLGERHNPDLAWALDSFARGTRKYWVVTTIFGVIVSLCNWGLLLALGVPLAAIWAVFSFVTNYIPNIGFLFGIIPPVIMAFLANNPLTALWVVVGYCVFNVLFQTFIQPKFAGDAVGITPTMAVLSLLLWAYILGPLGAILAIPATLLMKTLIIDIDPRTRWLNAFIASNPGTSDQDPIRLSEILARSKQIQKLTAIMHRPGVTPEEAADAGRKLASLENETNEASSEFV
ncbi:MAG: AI-2E family transporter [Propionibacteriaceae bacterium]|nr:AI-2E family transporter [Propionibacteriaceae bacterium]